ncbi:MAG: two-component system response regulator [Dehalococcoidia bacterium]|nr:two-component system response regulator [Dehalococcoidia bacterium]
MRGNKILVVDDEPNIVRSLAFVFNKEGYQVSIAENGEEAMEMIRGSKPDILILDVMMPHKNGYDVCQEIKSDPGLKDIHVLMLTAKGQKGDREAALARGADEYISKPFSPIQVLDRVKELLT